MSNWLERVGALWGAKSAAKIPPPAVRTTGRPSAPPPRSVAKPVPNPLASALTSMPHAAPEIDLQQPLFEWLIGSGPALDTSLHDSEKVLLAQLDAVLASDVSRNALLPRAPAVIPQLMNSLRDEAQSSGALAQRIAKDPHLVAEVIRMANGAQTRGGAAVVDLAEAIGRLGIEGLRRAIARVVLKPMFVGAADSLSARCADRVWQHSEAQATACQHEAVARGLAPFEGYLTGLMHNIGWSAALRAIDRSNGGAPSHFSRAFIHEFESRRERFFALLVMPWQLTESLTALGAEMLERGGLAATRSPLGQALHAANEKASREMLGDAVAASDPAVEVSIITH
ncbi:MAG TPA: HDOD domain-containing protein [Burkholderiaceae bacterium]|jgi:HD-like signal output (HDOD) protein